MDNYTQILLNSLKNVNSVNVDNHEKIELSNKPSLIDEYDISNILNATDIFNAEREANEIYRIYGKIEYMSLLNGLNTAYSGFSDFFNPQLINSKNIFNSFDFYLAKASTGYTQIVSGTSGNSGVEYIRYFKIIATPNEFDIYPAGFSNNVYGEQTYAFNFNVDFNVSNFIDNFGFPATELYLYAQYKPKTNYWGIQEAISATTWIISGNPITFSFTPIQLNSGDTIHSFFAGSNIGDLIVYSNIQFYQTQVMPQTFYFTTPYKDTGGTMQRLVWEYNPFIPITLRYFSNNLYKANISGTSYEQVSSIPYYATKIDNNGNYVWRTILPQGYTDPLTGIGVDYPFVNKKRYLFTNVILDIIPDLNDAQTFNAFENLWFTRYPTKLSVKPISDINNIGKPCQ